jgi:hypothetical protein
MNVNNKLTLGTLTLANFAANAAIGTAAATVDNFSSFDINQTTAGISLTVPAPTISEDGQLAFFSNTGTAIVTILGRQVEPLTGLGAKWDATLAAWIPFSDPGGDARFYYQQSSFVALTGLAVTHNFNLTAANVRKIQVDVVDANGNKVDVRATAYAANSVTLQSNVAVANANITVVSSVTLS